MDIIIPGPGNELITSSYVIPEPQTVGTGGYVMVSATMQTETVLDDGPTITQVLVQNQADQNATVTLTDNRTLAFSGLQAGMRGNLRVVQDVVGNHTLTLPANSMVILGGGSAVTLTAAGNAVDILAWYTPDGTNIFWAVGANFT